MSLDQQARYARCAMAHWMSDAELARLLPDDEDLQKRVRDRKSADRIGAVIAVIGVALLAFITPVVLSDEPPAIVAEVRK